MLTGVIAFATVVNVLLSIFAFCSKTNQPTTTPSEYQAPENLSIDSDTTERGYSYPLKNGH